MDWPEKQDLVAKHYRRLTIIHYPKTIYVIPILATNGTHVFYCTRENLPEVYQRLIALYDIASNKKALQARLAQVYIMCRAYGLKLE